MALIHMNFHSDVLEQASSVDVILPQSPTTQIGMGGKREKVFKTLYLLHGLSDDHTIWQRRTSIERYAAKYGIAVVMPSGGRSWYTDMVHGPRYFTYITDELPRLCRSFFSGMSEERQYNYIAGLSMGGYGSLKAAMAYPERYAGVASFSGAIDVRRFMENGLYLSEKWADVFGNIENIEGSICDVFGMSEKRAKEGIELPKIYLSCGTEDGLLCDTRRLHTILDQNNIEHSYREAPGAHTWDFWDDEIQRAMAYLFG